MGEVVPALVLWGVGGLLTLLDMISPVEPNPQYPDALGEVATIPGPLGNVGKACKIADNTEDLFNVSKEIGKSLGNNPFKGKTNKQIANMFKKKGFELKGPDPLNGKGSFVNSKTGRSYHIDANHLPPKPPHVGVGRPRSARDIGLPKSRDFDL